MSNRFEAERAVTEIEAQASFEFRMSSDTPLGYQAFVDRALREALVDALANSIGTDLRDLKNEIEEAQRRLADLAADHEIGSDFNEKISRLESATVLRFADRVSDLVNALAERVAEDAAVLSTLRDELADLKAEPKPEATSPSRIRIVRPGGSKRPKRGASTLVLPFMTPPSNEVVEVKDTVPSKIGKVEAPSPPKQKRGRRTKAA